MADPGHLRQQVGRTFSTGRPAMQLARPRIMPHRTWRLLQVVLSPHMHPSLWAAMTKTMTTVSPSLEHLSLSDELSTCKDPSPRVRRPQLECSHTVRHLRPPRFIFTKASDGGRKVLARASRRALDFSPPLHQQDILFFRNGVPLYPPQVRRQPDAVVEAPPPPPPPIPIPVAALPRV